MFECNYCGYPVAPDAVACPKCGRPDPASSSGGGSSGDEGCATYGVSVGCSALHVHRKYVAEQGAFDMTNPFPTDCLVDTAWLATHGATLKPFARKEPARQLGR